MSNGQSAKGGPRGGGSSFAKLRALCAMKQNGVDVASDFLLIWLTGTEGDCPGNCDDPGALPVPTRANPGIRQNDGDLS
jgi:hypothetical protein